MKDKMMKPLLCTFLKFVDIHPPELKSNILDAMNIECGDGSSTSMPSMPDQNPGDAKDNTAE